MGWRGAECMIRTAHTINTACVTEQQHSSISSTAVLLCHQQPAAAVCTVYMRHAALGLEGQPLPLCCWYIRVMKKRCICLCGAFLLLLYQMLYSSSRTGTHKHSSRLLHVCVYSGIYHMMRTVCYDAGVRMYSVCHEQTHRRARSISPATLLPVLLLGPLFTNHKKRTCCCVLPEIPIQQYHIQQYHCYCCTLHGSFLHSYR